LSRTGGRRLRRIRQDFGRTLLLSEKKMPAGEENRQQEDSVDSAIQISP